MKIVVGEVREFDVICESDKATVILPKSMFPKRVFPGDIANYVDGKIEMWDEEEQYEEEQLSMLFKILM